MSLIAVLPVRLAAGLVFFLHGSQRLFGWFGGEGLSGATVLAKRIGFSPPDIWGIVIALVQFGAGVFILAGLWVRFWASAAGFVLMIEILRVHWDRGFLGGYEYHFALFCMCITLALAGSGKFSLEGLISSRKGK